VPAFYRIPWSSGKPRTAPLSEMFFLLVVALVFLPVLFITVLHNRQAVLKVEEDANRQLRSMINNLQSHLDFWYARHHGAIIQLAEEAKTGKAEQGEFDFLPRILRTAFRDFHAVFITDQHGKAVAFYPRTMPTGESTSGLDVSEHDYFLQTAADLEPWISGVFEAQGGLEHPVQALTAPINSADGFAGVAVGILNLEHVRNYLEKFSVRWEAEIILLHHNEQIIATTIPEWSSRQIPQITRANPFGRDNPDLFIWEPEGKDLRRMTRWKLSSYGMEETLSGDYPATVVVRIPAAPLLQGLYRDYITTFAIALGLGFAAILLARYFGKRLSATLSELAATTTGLPSRISQADEISWPESGTSEIAYLIANFQSMTNTLKRAFLALKEGGQALAETNSQLKLEIHDRIRAEQEFRILNQELERRVQERTATLQETTEQLESFSYTVAHDLRAPLRSMQGFAQAVREDHAEQLSETGRDYLRRISESAVRMDQLILDLLGYIRVNQTKVSVETVELDPLLEQILAEFKLQNSFQKAEVRVETPLLSVLGHRQTLSVVIGNLVGNALKFSREEVRPRIVIRSEICGEQLRFWVEDNGIGIAKQHQERIFQVFERLASDFPGTGIGLALVKKGITRMGGEVGVFSEPGQGSRFWFALPKA
jgi:signal transduction histidine kinase